MTDATDNLLADILAFIAEVNRGDAAAALARFTDDVCIVEDLAPYRMTGADAGQKWLSAMGANAQKLGVTAVALHPAQPRRIEADDQTGYCILPGELTLDGPDAKLHAHGELTMAARRENGAWKFCAMTWAGDEPTPR
jgi:ketosteroid isomerase-like protein